MAYDYFSSDVRDENNYPVKNPPKLPSELTLKLDGAKTVRLRAITLTGQPVAGVAIRPWYVRREGNPGDTNFVSSAFSRETDATGLAIFDWLPHDVKHGLTFLPNAKGYDADPLRIPLKDIDDGQIHEIILKSITEISGRVVDDNDQPLAGATVKAPILLTRLPPLTERVREIPLAQHVSACQTVF